MCLIYSLNVGLDKCYNQWCSSGFVLRGWDMKGNNRIKYLFVVFITAVLFTFWMVPTAELDAAGGENYINLSPGDTYDFSSKSDYKTDGSIVVEITESGTYTLTGKAKNTILRIDPAEGDEVLVYLDGVYLAPDDTAPGSSSHRPAVIIGGSGGTVRLFSRSDKRWDDGNYGNVFLGQGHRPAIEKNNKTTKLIFLSDINDNGIITAKADPDGFRTCAIGCYSPNVAGLSTLFAYETGNIFFEHGKIYAYGSQCIDYGVSFDDYNGGPGIGANGYGSVDGITFNGGEIFAVAGDLGSAAIGTACAVDRVFVFPYPTLGSEAKNITINGGKITARHYHDLGSKPDRTFTRGGASIGGGYRTDAFNLVINGGDIDITTDSNWKNKPDVGIGAGNEGTAEVTINGGTIRIDARYVGIGTYAMAETDYSIIIPDPIPGSDDIYIPTLAGQTSQNQNATNGETTPANGEDSPEIGDGNTVWFGLSKIDIHGGDITIDSDDVCIGGCKPDSKKGYVEIDGGTLNLHSHGHGPAIGPWTKNSVLGKLHRVTIRGGIINAHVDDPDDRYSVIGSPYYTGISDRNFNSSIIDYVEITGGTVRATQGDFDNPVIGQIGGNLGSDAYDDRYSKVVINGGNVYATLLDGESSRPVSSLDKNAAPVYLQKIDLIAGDTPAGIQTLIKDGDFDTKNNDGGDYDYGLNDVYTFNKSGEAPLWFWMPTDTEKGWVETEKELYTDIASKKYYGLLCDSGTPAEYNFYPEIPLNLLRNATPSAKDGSATVHYGDKALTDFTPADDSGSLKLIDAYQSKPATRPNVLDHFGAYIIEDDHTFIDSKGRWIYVGEKQGSAYDTSVFKNGRNLYAMEGQYTLGINYAKNIPANTESDISGTFPVGKEYTDEDKVDLPDDTDFKLKGYTFKGWNTAADGSGTAYQSGQTGIPAGDFRKVSLDPSEVVLYAQWEPIKYKVTYKADVDGLDPVQVEYTYDEPGLVAGENEVSGWGVDIYSRLVSWTWVDKDSNTVNYYPSTEIKNFVDFDDDLKPVERTMTAFLVPEGDLNVVITTDGVGDTGLADDIVIREMTSVTDYKEHRNCFEEVPNVPGNYVLKSDADLGDMLEGYITIDYRLNDNNDQGKLVYEKNKTIKVELPFVTTTVDKGDVASSVSVTDENGNPFTDKDGNVLVDDSGRPFARTLRESTVNIDAEGKDGYHVTGWSSKGTEPDWAPDTKQVSLVVKGTSVLTPTISGNKYTVKYDPDLSFLDGDAPTGEMEPQDFTIGEAQCLQKSRFKKVGYYQDNSEGYAWNTYPFDEEPSQGGGKIYKDGEEIPADNPISYYDSEVTLYARWSPRPYTITFTDADANPHEDETIDTAYNEYINLKDDWKKDGYNLLGWTDGMNTYKPGQNVVNLCEIQSDGTLKGVTLTAVWEKESAVNVNIWLDDLPDTGKAADIKVVEVESGQEYTGVFTEDAAGHYIYDAAANLPENKTYRVSVDGYAMTDYYAGVYTFVYDKTKISTVDMNFYTNGVKAADGVKSVKMSIEDGKLQDQIIMTTGFTVSLYVETEDGTSFDKWSWDGYDSPLWQSDTNQTKYTSNETLVLTAHSKGNEYAVGFDANDSQYPNAEKATGEMEDQHMVCGVPQKLSSCAFARKGYRFEGWNTKPDGSGDFYVEAQKVKNLTTTDGERIVLYAQWEPLTYDIAYRDPDLTCSPQYITVKYDETIQLIASDDPNWKPGGKSLRGWTMGNTGKFYKAGSSVKNLCSINPDGSLRGVTLYAEWTDHGSISLYTTLDYAGINLDVNDIVIKQGEDEFSGCFVKDTDTAGLYVYKADEPSPGIPGGGKIPAGDYKLIIKNNYRYQIPAVEESFTYNPTLATDVHLQYFTVSIEKDEGIESVELTDPATGDKKESFIVREGTKLSINATVSDGYHFDGWSALKNDQPLWGKDRSTAVQDITVVGTHALMAHAEKNVYSVIFDPNDDAYPGTEKAEGSMDMQDMVYNEQQELFENKLVKKGYTFAGWNTKSDGSGEDYSDKEMVKNLSTTDGDKITLYARWEPREYKVSFVDPDNGCKTQTINVKYDETFTLIKADDSNWKPGIYTLRGWILDGTTTFYQPGAEVKNLCRFNADGSLSDVTLSAMWNEAGQISIYISVDKKGLDVDESDIVLTRGDKEYKGCFMKDMSLAGMYVYEPKKENASNDTGGEVINIMNAAGSENLTDGEYVLTIQNDKYELTDPSITFTYDTKHATSLSMDFYSVSIKKESGIASATVKNPSTGEDKAQLRIMDERKLDISAEPETGFHFAEWTYTGTAPVMDEGKSVSTQSITVTDTVELTAHAEMDKPKDDDNNGDNSGGNPSGDNSGNGGNNKTPNKSSNPKMGDGFDPVIWAVLLLISIVGIGVVLYRKKRS